MDYYVVMRYEGTRATYINIDELQINVKQNKQVLEEYIQHSFNLYRAHK